MIDFERVSLCLACVALLGCNPDTVAGDSAGSTTDPGSTDSGTELTTADEGTSESDSTSEDTGAGVCGDGVVDPGEACDDGNAAEDDGCTASCEIGLCGFEWVTPEPSSVADGMPDMSLVDGELAVTAYRVSPLPPLTRVMRMSPIDGTPGEILDISGALGEEIAGRLVHDPSGDMFVGSTPYTPNETRVRRLTSEGQQLWLATRPSHDGLVDLALGPNAELVALMTSELGPQDRDATIVGLDPADGSELWSADIGGLPARNGYSLDQGAAVAVDAAGRSYAGIVEFIDWNTTAPTVAAFAPGGGEPLWVVRALDLPGKVIGITSLAFGPDGTVYVTAQSWENDFETWLVALEPETGAVEWVFDYDQLPFERVWTAATDVVASEDRVLVVGYWSDFDGEQQVVEAYAMGFDHDGQVACIGTFETYDPARLDELLSWVPLHAVDGGDGSFYLGGVAYSYFDSSADPKPFTARVR